MLFGKPRVIDDISLLEDTALQRPIPTAARTGRRKKRGTTKKRYSVASEFSRTPGSVQFGVVMTDRRKRSRKESPPTTAPVAGKRDIERIAAEALASVSDARWPKVSSALRSFEYHPDYDLVVYPRLVLPDGKRTSDYNDEILFDMVDRFTDAVTSLLIGSGYCQAVTVLAGVRDGGADAEVDP